MSGGRRRTIPRIAAAVVASALLAGCGVGAPPQAAASTGAAGGVPVTAPAATPTPVVMIIRHGEKPDGSTPGLDPDGHEDASSLTAAGWRRAHGLVAVFDPAQGPPRPGLARPTAIYAAHANDDGEGLRTRETVGPLAAALGVPVDTSFGKGDEEQLAEQVVGRNGVTLICWQHGEIPDIVGAFANVTPTPPDEWPDERFDVVWVLTRAGGGWHFAQVPERVLPDDRIGVIGS